MISSLHAQTLRLLERVTSCNFVSTLSQLSYASVKLWGAVGCWASWQKGGRAEQYSRPPTLQKSLLAYETGATCVPLLPYFSTTARARRPQSLKTQSFALHSLLTKQVL
jgi:hypothetical protein